MVGLEGSIWAPKPAQQPSPSPSRAHAFSPTAQSFSPPPPPPDISSMDSFAQTGAQQDDLFDDVVPVEETVQTRPTDDLFRDGYTPIEQPVVEEQPVPAPDRTSNEKVAVRGRGQTGWKSNNFQPPRPSTNSASNHTASTASDSTQAPESAPTGPRKGGHASVRGDRLATGGTQKAKLTEDELTAKLAQMKVKNEELTSAYARQEADRVSFAERETKAKAKAQELQKRDRQNRQQMMGEREKNRMRKLKAHKEWDVDKGDEGKSEKRGAYGEGGWGRDQGDYTDGTEYIYHEGRGRGGRDRPRGGRGGENRQPQAQKLPQKEDFPSLPAAAQKEDSVAPSSAEFVGGGEASGSWADQMESSRQEGPSSN
ncbi:hypothetical protein MBLNU230_g0707t1 [Neophaeotheca triangularis]